METAKGGGGGCFLARKKTHFDPQQIFPCVQRGDTAVVGSAAKTLAKTCGINPVLVWIYNFPKEDKADERWWLQRSFVVWRKRFFRGAALA